jgi:transposase-like protein
MNFQRLKKSEIVEIIEELRDKRCNMCKRCGMATKNMLSKKDYRICIWSGCKLRQNIWERTIFYKSHLSKAKILRILEYFMINATRDVISYMCRVNKKTITKILKKTSRILIPKYYEASEEIGGQHVIVEVDESKLGKRKYNRGHHVEEVLVLGMVERGESKRIKLVTVDNRNNKTLTNKLRSNLNPESTVLSDCWKGYSSLNDIFSEHKTVNHSKHFKDPESGVHTNTIEGSWAGIKMHVPLVGRTKDRVNLYLVRYMLLKNEKYHPLKALIKYLF